MRAYERDNVSDADRAGAKHLEAVCGPVKLSELLESLRRNGPDPAILEAGLALEEEQYDRLAEAYKRTPRPDRPRIRRRR